MEAQIPEQQKEKLQPVVDRLRDRLRMLTDQLPWDAQSALVFEVKPEVKPEDAL
jgi:hypothetical protein